MTREFEVLRNRVIHNKKTMGKGELNGKRGFRIFYGEPRPKKYGLKEVTHIFHITLTFKNI